MAAGSDWEREADNWLLWARTPGHDAYWYYRDSFFDAVVPAPGRGTVELGCGEGRVTRDLTVRGHRVVAVDLSATLLRQAHRADTRGVYLRADAASLPLADASFDLAVAYNSLMDIADMAWSVREVARVLRPGGRFCVCVTHPLSDAGSFLDERTDAVFAIDGSYLGCRPFETTVERDGLTMTFRGWSHPLEDYARAFEDAGLLIELMREPTPAAAPAYYLRWHRLPMFLHLRAVKPG